MIKSLKNVGSLLCQFALSRSLLAFQFPLYKRVLCFDLECELCMIIKGFYASSNLIFTVGFFLFLMYFIYVLDSGIGDS